MSGATRSAWCRRSSIAATTASTSSTRSRRAPRRRCGQINFTGNRVFGKRQLNAVIKTSATNMLSFLTGGDVYDPDRIAQDQEQLRLYYRSKGYADASVPSANGRIRSRATRIYADIRDRRRPALSLRRHQRRLQYSGTGSEQASPARFSLRTGARVRRQRAGQDHRSPCHRDGEARLSLCASGRTPRITRDAAARNVSISRS